MDFFTRIDLDRKTTHAELIFQIQPIINATSQDKVEIHIYIGMVSKIVYPDQMLLVVSIILEASDRGVEVVGSLFAHSNCEGYVSRMDFYDHLKILAPENFVRRDSKGQFLEITRFNDDDNESLPLVDKIKDIFIRQKISDDNLLASIDLAISELICNIRHSLAGQGWITAQYYKTSKRIRLMIADTGIGIHRGLTDNPKNLDYKFLTPKQSIRMCIDKGVTNGTGGGRGLYIVHNLIKENGGMLAIYSGNEQLHVSRDRIFTNTGSLWPGTCVFLEILSNRTVDVDKINGGDTSFYDLHMDKKEDDWFL